MSANGRSAKHLAWLKWGQPGSGSFDPAKIAEAGGIAGVGFCQSAFGEGMGDIGHGLADPRCSGSTATERGGHLGSEYPVATTDPQRKR